MNKIIIIVPHSSTNLTKDFLDRMLISNEELHEQLNILIDYYTDEIFKNETCFNVICEHSRLLCDVERFKNDEDEPMSKVGMGAIYTKTPDGKDLIKVDEEYKQNVLKTVYEDYNKKLNDITKKVLEKNGECIIIDGHSFSEEWARMLGNKEPFPDICIGYDEEFCDYQLIENLKKLANKYGFSCKENYPFLGAMVPSEYYKSKDKRVKSIMIEINKKIYIDEKTCQKTEGFEKVKRMVEEVACFLQGVDKIQRIY